MRRIALQLYTVREAAEKDLLGTLKAVRAMGYSGVEFSSLYRHEPNSVRRTLDGLGLEVAGITVPFADLESRLGAVADECRAIGASTVICPWLDPADRDSAEAAASTADRLNAVGRACRDKRLRFLYHLHGYEFADLGGVTCMGIFEERLDPELVGFELDTYWVEHAGVGAASLYRRIADRCPSVHVKDMKDRATKRDTEVGAGIVDVAGLLREAYGKPLEWLIVEQEEFDIPPLESVAISLRNLKRIVAQHA